MKLFFRLLALLGGLTAWYAAVQVWGWPSALALFCGVTACNYVVNEMSKP